MKNIAILTFSLFIVSCASALVEHKYNPTPSIGNSEYSQNTKSKGVVLLSVNWNRTWKCGGYENAELRSIGFDLLPSVSLDDNQVPDFVVNGSASYPGYTHFAFQLEPGEYAISYAQIKVAKSVNDVGYLTLPRSKLLTSEVPKGGSFTVASSEVVYIGHFHLDCAYSPILWRYYIESKDDFDDYVKSFSKEYPFLNTSDVQFRLFKTNEFGTDYQLP